MSLARDETTVSGNVKLTGTPRVRRSEPSPQTRYFDDILERSAVGDGQVQLRRLRGRWGRAGLSSGETTFASDIR
jgi:hypothetical protein